MQPQSAMAANALLNTNEPGRTSVNGVRTRVVSVLPSCTCLESINSSLSRPSQTASANNETPGDKEIRPAAGSAFVFGTLAVLVSDFARHLIGANGWRAAQKRKCWLATVWDLTLKKTLNDIFFVKVTLGDWITASTLIKNEIGTNFRLAEVTLSTHKDIRNLIVLHYVLFCFQLLIFSRERRSVPLFWSQHGSFLSTMDHPPTWAHYNRIKKQVGLTNIRARKQEMSKLNKETKQNCGKRTPGLWKRFWKARSAS